MRQNRRRYARTTSLNHKLMAIFAALGLVAALGALAELSIKATISRTGREISRLEKELHKIREERIRAEKRWSECSSPERLDAALKRHGLQMSLAGGERIVSLRNAPAPKSFMAGSTEVAKNGPLPRN